MKKSNKSIVVLWVFLVAIILSIRLINNKREEIYELDSNNLKEVESKGIAILYKDSDNENYKETDNVPVGNYEVTEDSYCTKGNSTDHIEPTPNMEYKDNKVYIKVDSSGLKCFVYLKKVKTASEKQLADLNLHVSESGCPAIGADGLPIEELTNETSSNGYLCEGIDDDGKTYYFRGHKEKVNNWVQMGSTYWRIIRINGDGSIRLIYNGTSTSDTGIAEASVAYNSTRTDNKYVGFMYGNSSTDYKSATTNQNPSNILTELDKLYGTETVIPSQYKDKIDENAGFCNDRTPYSSESGGSPETGSHGFGSATTYYGAYIRVRTTKKPTFKCPKVDLGDNESVDNLFTTTNSEKGNKALTNPIGLITADEVMYAGAVYNTANQNHWLYNNNYYWTMSPRNFDSYAYVFCVDAYGSLGASSYVHNTLGVRPVINLKAGTKFTTGGEGTSGEAGSSTNPYVVQLS